MTISTIGDLARGFALRNSNAVLKNQMTTLSKELSSGTTADVTRHLSGNFAQLSEVRHKLVTLESYRSAIDQGRTDTSVMQIALQNLSSETANILNSAVSLGTSSGTPSFSTFASDARAALGSMISTLNVTVSGRSLFAGNETSTLPLVPQDAFIAAVQSAAAGASSAADLNAALDTFFDTPGGGFDSLIYQGGSSPRTGYQLGNGESVMLDLKADDPMVRFVLKNTATIALLDDASVTLSAADRADLTRQVGEALLGGQDWITGLQADLGFAENRMDRSATRIATEISSLKIVQSNLVSVDPFEAATELEAVQIRLETLYTLTSRMSRLNLVSFLS